MITHTNFRCNLTCYECKTFSDFSPQTALLSASYDNIIFKAKQVICLESLYLKKDLLAVLPTGCGKSCSICRFKSAFRKFAKSARAVHEKEKITQSQVCMKHHADGSLKIIMFFFFPLWLIYRLVPDIPSE